MDLTNVAQLIRYYREGASTSATNSPAVADRKATHATIDGSNLELEISVYHGGQLICRPRRTAMLPLSMSKTPPQQIPPRSPRREAQLDNTCRFVWDEVIQLDLLVSEIPLAARIAFTLHVYDKRMTSRVPVGWVAMHLFDHHDLLVEGLVQRYIWPEGAANPIGSCASNAPPYHRPAPDSGHPCLLIEFPVYSDSLQRIAYTPVTAGAGLLDNRQPTPEEEESLREILTSDRLHQMKEAEKSLIWRCRLESFVDLNY